MFDLFKQAGFKVCMLGTTKVQVSGPQVVGVPAKALKAGVDLPVELMAAEILGVIERMDFCPDVSHVEKLVIIGYYRDSIGERVKTLLSKPAYRLNVTLNDEGKWVTPAAESFDVLIKEDHASKGFTAVSGSDTPYGFYDEQGNLVSFEDPKKAISRITRLCQFEDGVSIGSHKFFVAADVPAGLIQLFNQGNIVCPIGIVEQYGFMRLLSGCGSLKGTTLPIGNQWIATKSSFKAGLNGLLMALTGKSVREVAEMDSVTRELILAARQTQFEFMGYTLQGWTVDLDVIASHFYVLHGLRTVDQIDDVQDEDSFESESVGSFYLSMLANVRENAGFDLVGAVMAAIDQGQVRYRADLIKIKQQELSCAYWSYGQQVGDKFNELVARKALKLTAASTVEALNLQAGIRVRPDTFDAEQVSKLEAYCFKGHSIPTGSYDPAQFGRDSVARFDFLLNGMEGSKWPGLLKGGPKRLSIGGQSFWFPCGATMSQFMVFDEDTKRWLISGPAQTFMLFLIAVRSDKGSYKVDWAHKKLTHNNDLQQVMLGKNLDGLTVRGSHKLIINGFWLRQDQVALINQDYKNGERVVFSKMPVFFNRAIADVSVMTGLPRAIFGELSERMYFALKSVVFVNNQLLLDHQNDSDGDLGRVFRLGGVLPLYTGLPVHMKQWAADYAADEGKLAMSFKDYKVYSKLEIDIAVKTAMEMKAWVGKGTNSLFAFSYMLELAVARKALSFNKAQQMRDHYCVAFQQSVVRGIKHSSTGCNFTDMPVNALLGAVEGETAPERIFIARSAFGTEHADGLNSLIAFYESVDNAKQLFNRRNGKSFNLRKCKIEAQWAVLDSFTNSWLKAVSEKVLPRNERTVKLIAPWMEKNIQLAVDSCGTDTVMMRFFATWREVFMDNHLATKASAMEAAVATQHTNKPETA